MTGPVEGVEGAPAEAEVHERDEPDEQYRRIFEAANDALTITDVEGYIVEANPAACRMYGYSYEELIGLHSVAVTHPDYHHLARTFPETVRAGGSIEARAINLRKDGTPFYIEERATGLLYRGRPHILSVIRDITDQVRAEEQLREREAQYRRIFEATSDGLIINDLTTGVVIEANPAVCRMHGYTYDEFIGLHPTAFIHPDYHPVFADFVKAIAAGDPYETDAIDVRKDGTAFNVAVHGSPVMYKGRPHILAVVRDITERVQSRALLEKRVEERTRELATLLDVSHNVASTLELQPLLSLILDQLKAVVEYRDANIMMLDGAELVLLHYLGPLRAEAMIGRRFPLARATANQEVIRGRKPLIIGNIWDDTPLARSFREVGSAALDNSHSYFSSWLGVPLMYKEQTTGMLGLSHSEPHHFTERHATLALAIANQAAVAIENARLYEQTMQRTSELSALLDVSRNVASTLELQPLLELILDQLNLVADNDGMTLLEVRGDEFVVLLRRAPGQGSQDYPRSYATQSHGPIWDRLRRGEVVIIGDVRGADPLAQAYQQTVGDFLTTSLSFERSFMAVPLMLKDRIIGLLGLSSARPDYYTPHQGEVALAIAQQAAIAMENARLYQQAQEVAVLEERQRLSRELHDSVSQALYGIALGAQTARTLLERDPAQAGAPIEYVLALAERGLAEMRALILELRPDALQSDGLVGTLQKHAAALQARHGLTVQTALPVEPDAPLDAKEALYRIAVEALHNTVKHAHAQTAQLCLEESAAGLALEVRDDGAGFDPQSSFAGHLGLQTMQERAEQLGGRLVIDSAPGAGTRVRAQIPRPDAG